MFCDFKMKLTFLNLFSSLLPGRLCMCCLTRSVQIESRSLAMDTVSKLFTGTPVKRNKQPRVTVCCEQMYKRIS